MIRSQSLYLCAKFNPCLAQDLVTSAILPSSPSLPSISATSFLSYKNNQVLSILKKKKKKPFVPTLSSSSFPISFCLSPCFLRVVSIQESISFSFLNPFIQALLHHSTENDLTKATTDLLSLSLAVILFSNSPHCCTDS